MAQGQYVSTAPVSSEWSSSLFGCFDDFGSCLNVHLCPCCANARQWDAVSGKADSMNMMICLADVCCGLTYFLNCMVRCNIATKFGIPESSAVSCCISLFCPECGMCQQHRELAARGFYPGGMCTSPPAGYQPAIGMVPMGQQPQQAYAQMAPHPGYVQQQPQPQQQQQQQQQLL